MISSSRDRGFVTAVAARKPSMRFFLAVFMAAIFAIESPAALNHVTTTWTFVSECFVRFWTCPSTYQMPPNEFE